MLTDVSVLTVASHCKLLETVNIGSTQTTDAAFIELTKRCRHLRSISANICTKLTDAAASAIVNNCPNIQYLNMYLCSKLTDSGVVEILQKCRQLRALVLCVRSWMLLCCMGRACVCWTSCTTRSMLKWPRPFAPPGLNVHFVWEVDSVLHKC